MKLKNINIRDPFILKDEKSHSYYLYSNNGSHPEFGKGFCTYVSKDLKDWSDPIVVFKPNKDFWGTNDFWAPEVYCYKNEYYLIGTFSSENHKRGCQILKASSPLGPFEVYSEIVTPEDNNCLDGTLYFKDDKVYLIYCHEWIELDIGTVEVVELSSDLRRRISDPVLLFKGTDAKWVGTDLWFAPNRKVCITDGVFVFEDGENKALLWSSYINDKDYGTGVAYPTDFTKPTYKQSEKIFDIFDAGHSMVLNTFENENYLVLHVNNKDHGKERAELHRIWFENGEVKVDKNPAELN